MDTRPVIDWLGECLLGDSALFPQSTPPLDRAARVTMSPDPTAT